jgi:hypothetical protein
LVLGTLHKDGKRMKKERYEEICWEVHRRLNLWLDNTTFEKMTVGYSKMRFHMAIGLGGYPFEKEPWMDKDDFKPFVTDEEFYNPMCDYIVDGHFDNLMKHAEEI